VSNVLLVWYLPGDDVKKEREREDRERERELKVKD
jgi:hypothetical protein